MIISDEKRAQIMSYIVYAGEILQEDNHFPKRTYKYAYLPQWPELYTGTLKAWWYLFLDKKLKRAVFVIQQNEYPKEIVYYWNENEFLIRWCHIKNIKNEKRKVLDISNELFDQLLYTRLITEIDTISLIGVWAMIKKTVLKKEIDNLWSDDYWIIVIGKSSEELWSKTEDMIMIDHMINKKYYKKNVNWLGNIFIYIAKLYKKDPELVAYIHSSEIWIKTIPQIWYMCMVA